MNSLPWTAFLSFIVNCKSAIFWENDATSNQFTLLLSTGKAKWFSCRSPVVRLSISLSNTNSPQWISSLLIARAPSVGKSHSSKPFRLVSKHPKDQIVWWSFSSGLTIHFTLKYEFATVNFFPCKVRKRHLLRNDTTSNQFALFPSTRKIKWFDWRYFLVKCTSAICWKITKLLINSLRF